MDFLIRYNQYEGMGWTHEDLVCLGKFLFKIRPRGKKEIDEPAKDFGLIKHEIKFQPIQLNKEE